MSTPLTPTPERLLKILTTLALNGLESMYDRGRKLFTYRIRSDGKEVMPFGSIVTYTATNLIGMTRVQDDLSQTAISWENTLTAMVGLLDQMPRPGDLGLTLWADALGDGRYLRLVLSALEQRVKTQALETLPTMELAWILTGLCYASRHLPADTPLQDFAWRVYAALIAHHYPTTGLFRHAPTNDWPTRLRSHIGTFADQIYPIYALAAFYEHWDSESAALESALQCSRRICDLQGPQGQWWWHYHAGRGDVAGKYPVYSVHQDGMAIMGLLKLSQVSGQDFRGAAWKGTTWLSRANELGVEMVDWDRNLVWRDIERAQPFAWLRYPDVVLSNMGWPSTGRLLDRSRSLRLNREMRPYHYGWILYGCTQS